VLDLAKLSTNLFVCSYRSSLVSLNELVRFRLFVQADAANDKYLFAEVTPEDVLDAVILKFLLNYHDSKY
jgi:hypothetical protein